MTLSLPRVPTRFSRPAWVRYGLALALVLVAGLVRLPLHEILGDRAVFIFLIPAVLVAALFGGTGPGLVATLAGAALSAWTILPPHESLAVDQAPDRLALMLYLGVAGALVILQTRVAGEMRRTAVSERRAAQERRTASARLALERERYRTIFDQAAVGIEQVAPDGRLMEVNAALCAMLGRSREELLSLSFRDITHPDDAAADERAIAMLFGGEVPSYTLEKRYLAKDGTPMWVLLTSSAVHDAAGRVLYRISVIQDLRARKAAEDEVRRLTADLERLVQERTAQLEEVNLQLQSFAYSVSHDLRAPLRSVRGFAQALHEDYADQLPAEARDYLDRMSAAATRMDTLILDLLAYSRLQRVEVPLGPVPLRGALSEALGELSPEITRTGARVRIERVEGVARASRALLHQVMTNLISNALKFVPPGGTPDVCIRAEEREPGWLRLWVVDRGIGISPAHQEKIFSVFERLHGTETYAGTGIGLAIVRKAAERMGGRAGVESEPGGGSRFWVDLRRAEDAGAR